MKWTYSLKQLIKMDTKETENMSSLLSIKEIGFVTKKLPTKTDPSQKTSIKHFKRK